MSEVLLSLKYLYLCSSTFFFFGSRANKSAVFQTIKPPHQHFSPFFFFGNIPFNYNAQYLHYTVLVLLYFKAFGWLEVLLHIVDATSERFGCKVLQQLQYLNLSFLKCHVKFLVNLRADSVTEFSSIAANTQMIFQHSVMTQVSSNNCVPSHLL